MQKKSIVLVLALALVFSFSVIAMADEDLSIKLTGAVEAEVVVTAEQLAELEQITATYHSINSGATELDTEYTGFKLSDLIALATPSEEIVSVTFVAGDGYVSKTPLMLDAEYLNDLVPIIVYSEEEGYQVIVPQKAEGEVNTGFWTKGIVEVQLNAAEVAEEEEDAFVIPVPKKVVVSTQALSVDGEAVEAEAYNIDGSNYFKLRDLAALLTGSGSQFNVGYEAPNVLITKGEAYTKAEGDLVKGADKSASCVPSAQVVKLGGEQVDVLVYNIGGNNYFQLRNLGELIGFYVDYDAETSTIIVESKGYIPEGAAPLTINDVEFTLEQIQAAAAVEGKFTNKKGEEVAYKGVKIASLVEKMPAAEVVVSFTTWDHYTVADSTGAALADAVLMLEVGGVDVSAAPQLLCGEQIKYISTISWEVEAEAEVAE